MNYYSDWNRRIYDVSFVLYDLNDTCPTYFDSIYEFLNIHHIGIGKLVYRLNHSTDNYIYIRFDNATYKLYYIED